MSCSPLSVDTQQTTWHYILEDGSLQNVTYLKTKINVY
jgi:hypothetical protein